MKLDAIRQQFIRFFVEKGHTHVPSSPLIPRNDPSLLFTNSGMVQFKGVFLGEEKRSYQTAVTAQRCLRAGGKHNDLENIGYTARHHTFFEMLGNFSFGAYFKKHAIELAWEFLLGHLKLDSGRLWVTVHQEDPESLDIWRGDIGIPSERIIQIAGSDNFWTMGASGPCGPCTEIFFDYGDGVAGGLPGSGHEGDRYTEIWNLVFMQYNQLQDGSMEPLARPCVDTGMGLERIASVLQGHTSNFDIDLFQNLIARVAQVCGCGRDADKRSLQVIADHIRAIVFLITDGIQPGNEGRAYVLRRIIRRAIRHGYQVGVRTSFLHRLVPDVVRFMAASAPELESQARYCQEQLLLEEQRFMSVLADGMKMLESKISTMKHGQYLSGADAFQLHDTYGFPLDLTMDVLRERGLGVDQKQFEIAMQQQRERARAASHFGAAVNTLPSVSELPATIFEGYEHHSIQASVVALYQHDQAQSQLKSDEPAWVMTDRTCFYPEGGGQVADCGTLYHHEATFEVDDCQKLPSGVIAHRGRLVSGLLNCGERVDMKIESVRRQQTACNHTATHLMHQSLKQVLGDHVRQKGSLVNSERLRFDFSHGSKVQASELRQIEAAVNLAIQHNLAREVRVLSMEQAKQTGACYMADEDYGDRVRVVGYGDFSLEFCSGTHVASSGEIGLFKITQESSIAAGVRRIEAMTGMAALNWSNQRLAILEQLAAQAQSAPNELPERLKQLQDKVKKLQKSSSASTVLKPEVHTQIGDRTFYTQHLQAPIERGQVLRWQKANPQSLLLLTQHHASGPMGWQIAVGLQLSAVLSAQACAKVWLDIVGGKGGGNDQNAQGGGSNAARKDRGLEALQALFQQQQ